MKTLILTAADIRRLVLTVGLDALMDAMIDRLEAALRCYDAEQTAVYPRRGFAYTEPSTGLLEWMPCMSSAHRATIKVVGYHPHNAQRHRLPTILATASEYDTTSGHLTCMMDATFLTALRTGAASAVASRILAIPDAGTVGLVGAGAQAVTQLHALTRIFDLRRVLVYDVEPAHQASFGRRTARFAAGVSVEAASPEQLAAEADVVCTATSVEIGAGPVMPAEGLQPWVHVNAVGSDFPGKMELPAALLRDAFVCPDNREQAVLEGECQQLEASQVGPELWEVVRHQDRFQPQRHRRTVFDSTGWALEDQVAMHLLMEYATELGIGTRLAVEIVTEDPLDPYHFLEAPTPVAGVTAPGGSGRARAQAAHMEQLA